MWDPVVGMVMTSESETHLINKYVAVNQTEVDNYFRNCMHTMHNVQCNTKR